jgi:hypothetical protein
LQGARTPMRTLRTRANINHKCQVTRSSSTARVLRAREQCTSPRTGESRAHMCISHAPRMAPPSEPRRALPHPPRSTQASSMATHTHDPVLPASGEPSPHSAGLPSASSSAC